MDATESFVDIREHEHAIRETLWPAGGLAGSEIGMAINLPYRVNCFEHFPADGLFRFFTGANVGAQTY